ncbi:MAG: AsmA family protein [Magnetospirillum sp.]|nr:AsmA family protein [Magnetospirillum sp.]
MAARPLSILAAVLGTLVVLAAGFLVFVFDWNWLRGPLGERAGGALGRGVAIDGPLHVGLGRTITVHAEGVRIGNPDWAGQPNMARLDAIDATIRLFPLLVGRVELPELRLARPRIALEKNPQGEANWRFGANPKGAAAVQTVVPEKRATFPIIEHLVIEDGRLTYSDPAAGLDIDTHVATAVGGDPAHEQVRLAGTGSLKGEPAEIKIEAGSLLTLRDPSVPYPILAEAQIGATRARIAGTIAEPLDLEGVALDMSLAGRDMADIFPIFGIPIPATRPYAIAGHLTRRGPDWSFQDFRGHVGESDLSGGLTVVTGGERPVLRGNLVSERLALADLAGFIGGKPGRPDEASAAGRVLPDQPVNLGKLRAMDVDVRFTGRRVEAPGLPMDGLTAALVIENGRAVLQPLDFTIAQGSFAGNVELDGRQPVPRAKLDMEIRRMDLHRFFAGTRFAPQTAGTLAGRIELAARGRSTAELLGGADGRATVLMAGGSISALLVEAAGLDIARALGLVLSQDQPMAVRCLVADFELAKGDARSRALVLDTEGAVITGEGDINLRDERLGLKLTAHPKDASPLSARAPVLVGGSLGRPEVGVDTATQAARGGLAVALGALLTPLAALIPFLEPGLGEDQDCGRLIQEARAP